LTVLAFIKSAINYNCYFVSHNLVLRIKSVLVYLYWYLDHWYWYWYLSLMYYSIHTGTCWLSTWYKTAFWSK